MSDRNQNRFRYYYLPYCLQRLRDGSWLPLNRNYKPLGTVTGEWVDYDAAPLEARLHLSADDLRALSISPENTGELIFLYDDGCVPIRDTPHWQPYCARLEHLATR